MNLSRVRGVCSVVCVLVVVYENETFPRFVILIATIWEVSFASSCNCAAKNSQIYVKVAKCEK